jgi:hypothetical protein
LIEKLTDMPDGTLGFRVSGKIVREDYTNLLEPELKKALDSGDNLRTLYVIESLERMEPSALWEDSKTGFNLGVLNRKQWDRSAIVTDIDWMVHATKLFAWLIPGEARVYPLAEVEEAKRWLVGEAS